VADPKYQQVACDLQRKIEGGHFPVSLAGPGLSLEIELAKGHGASAGKPAAGDSSAFQQPRPPASEPA
jgi:hypothetical protein